MRIQQNLPINFEKILHLFIKTPQTHVTHAKISTHTTHLIFWQRQNFMDPRHQYHQRHPQTHAVVNYAAN